MLNNMFFLFAMAAVLLSALAAGGCSTGPTKMPPAVVIGHAPAPAPIVIPAECKPGAQQGAVEIAKVAGDKTPPENVDQAALANVHRLEVNRVTSKRCYCAMAAGRVTASDKAEAKALCAG